jgi:hypothetical protein
VGGPGLRFVFPSIPDLHCRGMFQGNKAGFPRFLRTGEAHCRSLDFARDDKGRVVTYLKACESDGEFFCAIRVAGF